MADIFGGDFHFDKTFLDGRSDAKSLPKPAQYNSEFAKRAASRNDIASLTLALQNGVSINDRNAALLVTSTWNGCLDTVAFLLSQGADPNIEDSYGNLPLSVAAIYSPDLIDMLVSAGASVDGNVLSCPIINALRKNAPQSVKHLLALGASLNVSQESCSTLYFAALSGNPELIEVVLKAAATANKVAEWLTGPHYGIPAIALASNPTANPLAMQLLLDAGVDPCTRTSRTSLLQAAVLNNLGIARMLLAASPKVRLELLEEPDGAQPLLHRLACMGIAGISSRPKWEEVMEMFALLISAGADINRVVPKWGAPLHGAVKRQEGVTHTLRALLHFGANINVREPQTGNTPLHVAVECNVLSVVELLVYNGADRAARNNEGKTPLDLVGPVHEAALAALSPKLVKLQ